MPERNLPKVERLLTWPRSEPRQVTQSHNSSSYDAEIDARDFFWKPQVEEEEIGRRELEPE